MSNLTNKTQVDVQQFWNSKPCDSENSDLVAGTPAYYEEIERNRYAYQGHIPDIIDKLDLRGKEVLEIGTGVGTDARRLISCGAIYNGINVDEGSCAATRQALETFGMSGTLTPMTATSMSFPNNRFDLVYTFGVLHHIPEVDLAVGEIHRVLKPGAKLLLMVYNRSSINYLIEIRLLRKLMLRLLVIPGVIPFFGVLGFPTAKLRRHVELFKNVGNMSSAEWLSRNTDGPDNPYSRVYDAHGIERLLAGRFKILANNVFYFDPRHWGILGRLLPKSLVDFLGRRWGWHRVVLAERV